MTIYYDNGEVEVAAVGGDILFFLVGPADEVGEVTLSASQARDIAAALVKAADEKEAGLREG